MRDSHNRVIDHDRVRSSSRPAQLADRGEFPLIEAERRKGRSYLDSASSTQKPARVIDAIKGFYETTYANVHRGIHRLSEQATRAVESARRDVGRFIGAESPEQEVIFCRGVTEGINLVAHAWGNVALSPGDEIVLTTMEHHSNLVPWQLLAQRRGVRLVELQPDDEGCITPEALERVLSPRTKLVGMTHVSNLLGTINDLEAFGAICRGVGAVFLIDGAQALGHMPVDVVRSRCDIYVGSGHKMFGPSGIGFLYGRRKLLETFEPFLGGGDMIEQVFFDRSTYAPLPARLEAGTPNIEGIVGLGETVRYLESIGMQRIRAHDQQLVGLALERLSGLPWLEIYGPRRIDARSGLVAFNVEGVHAHDAGSILDMAGVAVRAGHLCAQPLLRHLGRKSCVRASFALYNGVDDVDRLLAGLDQVAEYFNVSSTQEVSSR